MSLNGNIHLRSKCYAKYHNECTVLLSQKIRISSSKGTTSYFIEYPSKSGFLNQSPSLKKQINIHTTEKFVCDTCQCEIDSEICRIMITRNVNGEPQFFSFHFFSPCWDMGDFLQRYPHLTFEKMAFSIRENIHISEKGIKDLQKNESYWLKSEYKYHH